VGEGDNMYFPFEEAFHKQVSPNLSVKLKTECFAKIREIGIEVGTTKSIDELCMDAFFCDDFLLFWSGSGIASWNERAVAQR
jgi:hypothetical protein